MDSGGQGAGAAWGGLIRPRAAGNYAVGQDNHLVAAVHHILVVGDIQDPRSIGGGMALQMGQHGRRRLFVQIGSALIKDIEFRAA